MLKRIKQFLQLKMDNAVKNSIKDNLNHYQNELAKARQEIFVLQNHVALLENHTPYSKEFYNRLKRVRAGDFSAVGYQQLLKGGFVTKTLANVERLKKNGGL